MMPPATMTVFVDVSGVMAERNAGGRGEKRLPAPRRGSGDWNRLSVKASGERDVPTYPVRPEEGQHQLSSSVPDFVAAQPCPYCHAGVPLHAKKCASCAEWLVETRLDWPSRVLKAIGYAGMTLSLMGAVLLWSVSSTAEKMVADPSFSGIDDTSVGAAGAVALWIVRAASIFMALQGTLLGVAIIAFAERGPRRPK
jgi:hypothetical protein